MGYESRIYVVEKYKAIGEDSKRYAEIIGSFNMCKFSGFGDIPREETDCFIYADDGNTHILEDLYGDPLMEMDIEDVITYLEEYQDKQAHYRRVEPLLKLLKGFNVEEWNDLVVLHYGY